MARLLSLRILGQAALWRTGHASQREIEREVVEAAQVVANGIAVRVADREQFLGCRFHKGLGSDRMVGAASHGASTTELSRWLPMPGHFIHDGPRSARTHPWIVGRQVGAAKREIERRLLVCLVLRQ